MSTIAPISFAQEWYSTRSERIGAFCLLLALLAGLVVLYAGSFVDETDNFVIGLLISQGYRLYEDVFSHHFPFAYFWSATIIGIFGKSILAIRLSILFFTIGSFAIAAHFSKLHLSIGIASIVWSIIGYIYRGNMVIYSVFSGVALMVVFSVSLSIVIQKTRAETNTLSIISIFATVALLSNPLSIYPIFFTIFLLSLTPKLNIRGLTIAFLIIIFLLPFGTYLVFTGTYDIFITDTITFNTQIYNKYLYADPVRIRDIRQQALSLLDILNRKWLNSEMMKPILKDVYGDFDSWIFTGFLYRLSIILSCLVFIFQRKYAAAAYTYLFATTILVIGEWEFRGIGFILAGLVAAAGLVSGEWSSQPRQRIAFQGLQLACRSVVACMIIWLVIRVATFTAENAHTYSYEATFLGYQLEAERIQTQIVCNRSDVSLAYYPGDPIFYWFTDMKPVSKYIFMFPWVAEIAVPDVIRSLNEHEAAVYIPDIDIWGRYRTEEYLKEVVVYLDTHYVQVEKDWYVAPAIAAQCHT